jgi:hypothetical protein
MNNFNEFGAWLKAARAAEDTEFEKSRSQVRDFLRQHGIAKVAVSFDGEGDDGSITDCKYEPATPDFGKTPVPGTEDKRYGYNAQHEWVAVDRCATIDEIIDDMFYAFLSSNEPGWEINEGSYGDITLDVLTGKIKLHCCRRIVEVDEMEGEF